ncbi:MAG TPA: Clp1/GlmU family protein [Actinomycetota bacterium]
MDLYSAVARVAERGGMVMALGGLDTGKSTFCRMCAEVAVRLGRRVAYLDLDVARATVGPPATVGLKFVEQELDLEPATLSRADRLYFVGAVSAENHELPLVIGAMKLATEARAAGVHLIVVDTTGFIDGTRGQSLKLHKVEVLQPDTVVGFQRGGELDPILGAVRRTVSAEVIALPVDPKIKPSTPDERATQRQEALRAAFEGPVYNWSVKPSVIVPAVPPGMEPSNLDRILVGMEDGDGHCIGVGILEWRRDGLHMISRLDEGARGLRLGSLRVEPDFRISAVDLQDAFFFG